MLCNVLDLLHQRWAMTPFANNILCVVSAKTYDQSSLHDTNAQRLCSLPATSRYCSPLGVASEYACCIHPAFPLRAGHFSAAFLRLALLHGCYVRNAVTTHFAQDRPAGAQAGFRGGAVHPWASASLRVRDTCVSLEHWACLVWSVCAASETIDVCIVRLCCRG